MEKTSPLKKQVRKFVIPKVLSGRPKIMLLYKNFRTREIEFPIHVKSEAGIFGVGMAEVEVYLDMTLELMTNKTLDIDSILCYQM